MPVNEENWMCETAPLLFRRDNLPGKDGQLRITFWRERGASGVLAVWFFGGCIGLEESRLPIVNPVLGALVQMLLGLLTHAIALDSRSLAWREVC